MTQGWDLVNAQTQHSFNVVRRMTHKKKKKKKKILHLTSSEGNMQFQPTTCQETFSGGTGRKR